MGGQAGAARRQAGTPCARAPFAGETTTHPQASPNPNPNPNPQALPAAPTSRLPQKSSTLKRATRFSGRMSDSSATYLRVTQRKDNVPASPTRREGLNECDAERCCLSCSLHTRPAVWWGQATRARPAAAAGTHTALHHRAWRAASPAPPATVEPQAVGGDHAAKDHRRAHSHISGARALLRGREREEEEEQASAGFLFSFPGSGSSSSSRDGRTTRAHAPWPLRTWSAWLRPTQSPSAGIPWRGRGTGRAACPTPGTAPACPRGAPGACLTSAGCWGAAGGCLRGVCARVLRLCASYGV